ncbi:ComEC family competence protein [Zunongwangia sp. SCSIO 43204]|uniref:ComEC/Rec2 family competence protein n=1 Tax=Zunongwangia sp. SCSIO 43204 TaxID=2779359 RepID=UPI001CA8A78E|nr:ComEC/Rec2 family competence protein [Zunongwangia sp. SCSIO 43204]UAB84740.1 ComEC family competence protein [Zunongwangia sp. SCSIO 43204]
MGYINIKILKFSIAFLCGILSAHFFETSSEYLLIFTGISIAFLLFFFFKAKSQLYQLPYFGICCFLVLLFFGSISYQLKFPENKSYYFSKFINSEEDLLKLKLTEELKPNFQKRFIAEALQVIQSQNSKKSQPVFGKILIGLPLTSRLKVGQEIIVPAKISEINPPLNPHQFNYQEYMKFQGIFHQIQLSEDRFLIDQKAEPSFLSKLRYSLLETLQDSGFKKDELSVIQALILGERTAISNELYQNYAAAGAIHILAVSGLHVGIVLLFLNFILKPLQQSKILKLILALIGIWSFALLTGLSASVVRASFMFSFVAFGLQINRKVNLLNTLFSAFFVLILINPFYVFQVGFQLSFAAVFSIALFQPKFSKLWHPKYKIVRFFYQIITVSICAQIGVLPLSLFYFHQFPGLFLLTNIVILPGLGILLISGILILILGIFDLLPEVLVHFYSVLVKNLNHFIAWVASHERFIINKIHLSHFSVLFLFGIIISSFFLLQQKKKKQVILTLVSIILFQISLLFDQYQHSSEEIFILNKSGSSIIAEKNAQHLNLYGNAQKDSSWGYIDDFKIAEKISNIEFKELENFYELKQKRIMVIDSTALFNFPEFNPDILILSNSPKVNLNRVIEVLKPDLIIADASNYPSFIELWEQTCLNKKVPFYQTGKKGAFNY